MAKGMCSRFTGSSQVEFKNATISDTLFKIVSVISLGFVAWGIDNTVGQGQPNKLRAFTEEIVQAEFVNAYNKANDDEKDQVAKAFQVMYGFDEINEEEFTDIETIDEDKNLEEIKRLLEGKHTIEIDGVSVPLIQHLKFRIGRPDIGIAKASVSQSLSENNKS